MTELRKVLNNLVHQLWVDHGQPAGTVGLDIKRAEAAEAAIEKLMREAEEK